MISPVKKILSNEKLYVPILAVILGLLSGILILLITGRQPVDFIRAIIRGTTGLNIGGRGSFFNARYLGEFIVAFMPLCLTGLSVGFAFKSGLFNIGSEGQLLVGSVAAIAVGLLIPPLPRLIHLFLVILAGMLAGAFWGFIPGILKALFRVHEVVVTIMLNYTALFLTNNWYMLLPNRTNTKTELVGNHANFQSDFLSSITNNSRLHWGFIVVIIALVVYWIIMDKTTLGYELKATGFNRYAALYSGINVNRSLALSMMISGAFAGLAGTIIAVGTFNYGRVIPGFESYGYDGIAVALVGQNHPLGILLSAMLFGALKNSQALMQAQGIPKDIISVIIAFIILFVAMQKGIILLINYLVKKSEKNSKRKTTVPINTITSESTIKEPE